MDIKPSKIGAELDITEESAEMLGILADAFADNADDVIRFLGVLADARARMNAPRTGGEADCIADMRAEAAADDAEVALSELLALLDPQARVTVTLLESGCRRRAGELWAAADQTMTAELARQRGDVLRFPGQRQAGQDAA